MGFPFSRAGSAHLPSATSSVGVEEALNRLTAALEQTRIIWTRSGDVIQFQVERSRRGFVTGWDVFNGLDGGTIRVADAPGGLTLDYEVSSRRIATWGTFIVAAMSVVVGVQLSPWAVLPAFVIWWLWIVGVGYLVSTERFTTFLWRTVAGK